MIIDFYKLILLRLFILSTIRPPELCFSLIDSLRIVTNYNPLTEYNYNQSKIEEKSSNDDDKNLLKSRSKEYLAINELPDSNPSAYTSVIQRQTNQVMINPFLAKKVGISTLVAGTLFYSFTILPLILMLTGTGPFSEHGPMIRRKRSLKQKRILNYSKYGTEHRELPLLTKFESNKFIQLLENTLEIRKVYSIVCKKLYLCKIYHYVSTNSEKPKNYYSFEDALLNTLGIVVEKKTNYLDFTNKIKFYNDAALLGISGQNCENFYPCNYHWNNLKNYLKDNN